MSRILRNFLAATVLSAPLLTHAAALFVIDDFSTPQTGTSIVQHAAILGGERDVIANGAASFEANGGLATASLPSGATSNFVLLDYDGADNSTATSFLLSGFDITAGGTRDRFRIDVSSVTGTVGATVRTAESLSNYAERTINVSSTGTVDFLLSDFGFVGSNDFSSVERIFLRFNLDADESITISQFSLVGIGDSDNPHQVPEPATLVLLALGLSGLALRRRRRRESAVT